MGRLKLGIPELRGPQKAEFERWIELRREGIGGSSAPAVIGMGRYGSRLEVWGEMTGLLKRDEAWTTAQAERLRWGNLDEDGVLAETARRLHAHRVRSTNVAGLVKGHAELLGIFRFKRGGQPLLRSLERPWQHYSLDGLCMRPDRVGVPCLMEAKTTSLHLADEWEDDIPEHVYVQVQHGLAVTGLSLAVVGVKIGGQELRVFEVERDEEVIALINKHEEAFIELVRSKEQPSLEEPIHPGTSRALKRLHPADNGLSIDLPTASAFLDERLLELKESQKKLGAEIEEIETRFRAWIGDATFGHVPGKPVVWSLKTTAVKAYEKKVEAYTYRTPRRTVLRES